MKKIKILAVTLLVVAAGTFLFTNESLFKAENAQTAVIQDGIFIGGIDVSGMTAEQASDAVNTYVENLKEQEITLVGPKADLKYTLGEFGLTANTNAAVSEAVAVGRSGNLINRFKILKDLESQDYVIDMGLSIDKQATAQLIYNKTGKINVEAIDNGLKLQNGTFVYVPGQEGNEVDIVTAVNELNAYIGSEWEQAVVSDAEFVLESIISSPRGSEEELSVVKDKIGTFSTNFSSSSAGRCQNLETGAAKINGTVLYPGDEFSVYEAASPFTKENGYELAGAYSNGDTIESFGGGICQVSTTLYNAVLNAELEIVQRYNHSMTVSYVDLSADAAIAGTYKDLKFKNNYDFPIYIEGYCYNKNITFTIYGVETRASNRTVTYESKLISENRPAPEFTLSSSQALGTVTKTRSEHIGYVAEYYKVVRIDGVEQERTRVNRSTYQASCAKYTVGVAGATAEQLAAINAAIATGDYSTVKAAATAAATVTPTPDTGTTTPDTGTTTPDTGTTTPDTGTTTPDAGTTTPDAGTTTPDAGTATPDAGTTTPDTGTTTPDAGTTTPDAGTTTPDAGTTTPDAGTTTPDAGTTSDTGTTGEVPTT